MSAGSPEPDRAAPARKPSWPLPTAAAAYLVLAVIVWWGVWSSHPAGVTTCGCGDAARFVWFFEWPAYALTHGLGPLHSSLLFHPTGLNLLDDTSVLGLSVPLIPVTLLFGPVASMNVALTLAPACSALAMYWLLSKWVSWRPAAFAGGLLYGFSPFMLTILALNQLNLAFLAIPPLMLGVLDEIVVRQRRPPAQSGLALAALATVQFFVGIELLAIVAVCVVAGLAMVAAGWARNPEVGRARAGHALRALGWAVGAGAVVLAWPVWYFAAGPAHLGGPTWSSGPLSTFGTGVSSTVVPGGLASFEPAMHRLGGYQGSGLPGFAYLGVTWAAAAVGGVLWQRRDPLVRLLGAVGVVSALLALSPDRVSWSPWRALRHLPVLGNVVEVRFSAVTVLCASALVGLTADRMHGAVAARAGAAGAPWRRWTAGVVASGMVVAVAAPPAAAMVANVPLATAAVALPPWFAGPGSRAVTGRVVLTYPVPSSGLQASQAWQAVAGMPFAMASGGGPAGTPGHAAGQAAAVGILTGASLPLGPAPVPTAPVVATVRSAMQAWGVTDIVVPDQDRLPRYDRGRSTAYAVGFFTAITGRLPVLRAGAWVWSGAPSGTPGAPVPPGAFVRCTGAAAPASVPGCVLASA